MFYSHTFLARKGPLGTVWCAAHLQHRLKKSHIASTDIPSTVERILYPEVPIALRMSGHLLLGVVRIYSKKVDYFHQDCTALRVSLLNIFRPVNVDLAENANQAQFNAITLPETFALDAVTIDDDQSPDEGYQDNHLKSLEDITLRDQHPAESDLYVRITFDDEIFEDSTHFEQRLDDPMQIANPPEVPIPLSPDTQNAGPSPDTQNAGPSSDVPNVGPMPDIQNAGLNQNEERQGTPEGESFRPFEVMRDYQGSDVDQISPILRPHQNVIDPNFNISPVKDTAEKEIDTPMTLLDTPNVHSEQQLQLEGTSSAHNAEDRAASDSFVNFSPTELSLRPSPTPTRIPTPPLVPTPTVIRTPTPEQPKPQLRKRKRKQFFDESIVLTNEFVKSALNDCADLVKKRKKMPCSTLEQWRYRENKKKKNNTDIFSKPVITGMCDDLQNLSSEDLNPKLLAIRHQLDSRSSESNVGEETERLPTPEHEVIPDVGGETERIPSLDHEVILNVGEEIQRLPSPAQETARVSSDVMETERLRSPDHEPRQNIEHIFPSPQQISPQTHATAETSSSLRIPSSVSEPRLGSTDPRSDLGMFTDSTVFEMDTPVLHSEERDEAIGTALSDIPESRNSMEVDELSFLELDNHSPPDSPGSHAGNTSARTRAVAHYLKNHSPLSKFPDGPTDLSLNSILEGRPRKLCARMFYEVTVLKSEGLIQVQQDDPYGDVILRLTSDNLDKI